MPLATFEGAIRVGQEKAVMVEEITLTYGFKDAVSSAAPAIPGAAPIPTETPKSSVPLAAALGS
jgi:3-hydroxyacyl-[acyl-carrier-protein] dehydratase